jgi:predicted metal-dependent hydrolase
VPRGTSERSIRRVLREHEPWIERRLRAARAEATRPFELGLGPGAVHLAGRAIPVERTTGRPSARLTGGRLRVGGDGAEAAAAVERWYRREAAARAAARIDAWAPLVGERPQRLSIRDPRSRWGSCSSRGTLSFSWRLVLAPAEILDYVVVHELCHLAVPNHSAAFWRMVEMHYPHRREAEAWLRRYGRELHRYRPASALEE